jgi:hypothetical protein
MVGSIILIGPVLGATLAFAAAKFPACAVALERCGGGLLVSASPCLVAHSTLCTDAHSHPKWVPVDGVSALQNPAPPRGPLRVQSRHFERNLGMTALPQ